jgi:hypothetical protein
VSSKISFQSNSGLIQRALDGGDSAAFSSHFTGFEFSLLPNIVHAGPAASTDYLQCQGVEETINSFALGECFANPATMLFALGY